MQASHPPPSSKVVKILVLWINSYRDSAKPRSIAVRPDFATGPLMKRIACRIRTDLHFKDHSLLLKSLELQSLHLHTRVIVFSSDDICSGFWRKKSAPASRASASRGLAETTMIGV